MPTTLSDQIIGSKRGTSLKSLSDAQLLSLFLERAGQRSEDAFGELVERHGPLVLRACRSIVKDEHEAQDAFQATFLLFARKSRGLWVRDSLAPWLHGVACRVASDARKSAARRRNMERRISTTGTTSSLSEAQADGAELAAALHQEIGRLPERYRSALILCDLQGQTHLEVARLLDYPVGTVKSRQSRARERLRERLARGGFILSPIALGVILSEQMATADVEPAIVRTTARVSTQFERRKSGGTIGSPSPRAELLARTLSASSEIAGLRRRAAHGILLGASALAATVLLVGPLSHHWFADRSSAKPIPRGSLASLRWTRSHEGFSVRTVTKVPVGPVAPKPSLR